MAPYQVPWSAFINSQRFVAADGTNIGAFVETTKGSNYTLVATDNGKRIVATAAITITVPTVGTLLNGFEVEIANDSGGTVTIDGPGSTNVSMSDGDIACILEVNSKQREIGRASCRERV